jgi:nucleotide-binding universal stress UspA family protein
MEPYPYPEKDTRERLVKLARERIPASVRYEILVISGDPAERVLNAARDLGADLIVIGTHGRTGLKHLILGSVAERVVRESPVPVLAMHAAPRSQELAC